MNRNVMIGLLPAFWLAVGPGGALAWEVPYGKGTTEANKERLSVDDCEDVSDWYSGTPEETTVSASNRHVKQGRSSLKFANRVDCTKGEKNNPVGWPRTGKNTAQTGMSDWSGYDFFECWVYAETSRESLPSRPVSIGFHHAGRTRSNFVLKDVKKDKWAKIVIPTSELADAKDVRSMQLGISEVNYKHGDRADFYVDDIVLTRFVDPAIAELDLNKRILYSNDPQITALYALLGRKPVTEMTVEFEIGRASAGPTAKQSAKAARQGELSLDIADPLTPGTYWGRLGLRNPQGRLADRKQVEFRVIRGPF